MILKLTIDDQTYEIDVDERSMQEAEEPDLYQRCQIVADRILGAFHTENQKMVLLMSGYILSRVPHVEEVIVDTTGDITLTEVVA